jgi:hypothetical protein
MKFLIKINGEYQLDTIYKAKWFDEKIYDARIVLIGKLIVEKNLFKKIYIK